MSQNEFLLLMADQQHPISAMAAHVCAGLFVLWVISLLWEGLLFKRVTHDPVVGKLSSAVAAWATLFLIRVTSGYVVPGVFRDFDLTALLVLCAIALWSGVRMRERIRLEDDL